VGWEIRQSGNRYYTRSRREHGRVVRQYIGTGQIGELAAAEDEERRQAKLVELQQLRRIEEADKGLESLLTKFDAYTNQIATWLLLAAGCHRPKRQWRRKRDQRTDHAS
jgi:hypothetical protein